MIAETLVREALACPTPAEAAQAEADRAREDAAEVRSILFRAHQRAVEAGDTRAMNETRQALVKATARCLELGR